MGVLHVGLDQKESNHEVECTRKVGVVDEMRQQRWRLWKFVDGVIVAGIHPLGVENVLAEVAMAHGEEDGARYK